jgi:hypothetical protein
MQMLRSSSSLPSTSHRTPDCFFQVLVPSCLRVVVPGIPILLWSFVCELSQHVTKSFCVVGTLYLVLAVILQIRSLLYFAKFYGPLVLFSPSHTLLTLVMLLVAQRRWRALNEIIARKRK